MTEDEYAVLEKVWRDKNMRNLYDLLVWYNNLEIIPFQTTIAKYVKFFRLENIDIFKMGVSIPGLAVHYSFKFHADNVFFSLFTHRHTVRLLT